MRRWMLGATCLALILAAAPPGDAAMFSKRYEFRHDVILEIGAVTGDGVRLDSVRFLLPATAGSTHPRTGGVIKAEVAVSNTSTASRRVGLALALFDDEGRLLGVATAGTRLKGIRPGRLKNFTLVFDHVNAEAHRATGFHVSLETD